MKSVRIRSYSGPYFSTFGLNTERYVYPVYGVFFGIQSKCGKIWTRITPNTDNFYAVINNQRMTSAKCINLGIISGGIRVRIPQELDVVAFWSWNLDVVVF